MADGENRLGVPLLERVADLADEMLVVSQPDRPAGRRLQLRATPLATAARERGIRVITPTRLRSEDAHEELARYDPDGLVLVAYGQIVPAHLLALGRVHDRAQAIAAVEEAAAAFDTFNLDLMYALPGQTLEGLDADLDQALALQPPHLSVYHLTIEPNTYFAKFPPVIPEDDLAYDMLDRITERTAASGLRRYEISAYARAGHVCAHNLNYWQFGDYLGIGAGAHSKLTFAHRVVRQVRYREPRLYMDNAIAGRAVAQSDEVGIGALPFEYMLNALRLKDGFTLAQFGERTGLAITSIQRGLEEAERKGLIQRDLARVWPTTRGFDFLSDLQSIFLPD